LEDAYDTWYKNFLKTDESSIISLPFICCLSIGFYFFSLRTKYAYAYQFQRAVFVFTLFIFSLEECKNRQITKRKNNTPHEDKKSFDTKRNLFIIQLIIIIFYYSNEGNQQIKIEILIHHSETKRLLENNSLPTCH
jgi:hypothetical protein